MEIGRITTLHIVRIRDFGAFLAAPEDPEGKDTVLLPRKQMPEGRELLGVVLAMTGVFLISTHGNPSHLVISPVALVSGELSAIALCIYMIAPENILKQYPTMLLMGWGQLISSLFLLPFCNILDSGVRAWTPAAAGAVVFIILGIVMLFVATIGVTYSFFN